jgi:head-tail adaptor
MGLTSSKLDRRVQFRRFTEVDDGYQVTQQWADYGSAVWAQKRDISDGEKWAAAALEATVTTRFTVRSSTFTRGITPLDRLTCGGVEYFITGIKEAGSGRFAFLEITATARAD